MTRNRDSRVRSGAVLCAGRAYCDLVFSGLQRPPAMGNEVFADTLSLHGGGGAWISAAWFSALGRQSTLCATLPAAPFDEPLRTEAKAAGVSLHACTPAAADSDAQITVAMVSASDRAFLSRRSGQALPPDYASHLDAPGLVHLHISELTTLIDYPDLVDRANGAGLSVSLDCGWDDDALARRDLRELLVGIDVFLPNEAEHEALARHPVPAGLALPLTIVKRGAAGARAIGDDGTVDASAMAVNPIDTTGAGDAFSAGFLHAWLAGEPISDCLAMGNLCGGHAVQHRGGATTLPDTVDGRAAPDSRGIDGTLTAS